MGVPPAIRMRSCCGSSDMSPSVRPEKRPDMHSREATIASCWNVAPNGAVLRSTAHVFMHSGALADVEHRPQGCGAGGGNIGSQVCRA
eukprot:5430505-Prymnesium_polylepis.1